MGEHGMEWFKGKKSPPCPRGKGCCSTFMLGRAPQSFVKAMEENEVKPRIFFGGEFHRSFYFETCNRKQTIR